MTDLYDVALQVTDDVFGVGTYAEMNAHHPDPGVQAAIARTEERFCTDCGRTFSSRHARMIHAGQKHVRKCPAWRCKARLLTKDEVFVHLLAVHHYDGELAEQVADLVERNVDKRELPSTNP